MTSLLALLGHTVAHAVDVQLLLEALGHTHHHVVEQGAGQAVERTGSPSASLGRVT